MPRNDNWGSRARIGMFIVGGEVVPEAEWWAMLPPNVSVHAARVTAPAPWARWLADQNGVEAADDLLRGARQFAGMCLSAVVIGHSSSSFLGGTRWDEVVVSNLGETLGPDVIVTTNGLDTIAALRVSGSRRPFLVFPPWYNDETVAAGIRYYEEQGFEPSGHLRHDPGEKWWGLAPSALTKHGLGIEQDVGALEAQITESCPAAADAVLIAGTGFRCVAILEDLERKLENPIISANQASLWHCLRRANFRSPIEGYGNLLKI